MLNLKEQAEQEAFDKAVKEAKGSDPIAYEKKLNWLRNKWRKKVKRDRGNSVTTRIMSPIVLHTCAPVYVSIIADNLDYFKKELKLIKQDPKQSKYFDFRGALNIACLSGSQQIGEFLLKKLNIDYTEEKNEYILGYVCASKNKEWIKIMAQIMAQANKRKSMFAFGDASFETIDMVTEIFKRAKRELLKNEFKRQLEEYLFNSGCTDVNNDTNQDLINTLEFMQAQGNTVLFILKDLNVDRYEQFKSILNESKFDDIKYNKLKTAVDILYLAKVYDENKLSTHIIMVCTSNDDDTKRSLMNTLSLFQKQNSALPILNNLNLNEYNQLSKTLHSFAFSGPKYTDLKKTVGALQKYKIFSTCKTGRKFDKQQLLAVLNKNDNQFIILSVLGEKEKKALREVLTQDFTLGYNNLRTMVELPTQAMVRFSSGEDNSRFNNKRKQPKKRDNLRFTGDEKQTKKFQSGKK